MLDDEGKPDNRYINTCLEYTDYRPIPWDYAMSDEYQQECYIKWAKYKEDGRCQ
jgi:hypothetical protein